MKPPESYIKPYMSLNVHTHIKESSLLGDETIFVKTFRVESFVLRTFCRCLFSNDVLKRVLLRYFSRIWSFSDVLEKWKHQMETQRNIPTFLIFRKQIALLAMKIVRICRFRTFLASIVAQRSFLSV